ncbi:MAG TPA: CDP-alcohol phosphatidyltransferase family protein [Cellvibrionaceae bacterium]
MISIYQLKPAFQNLLRPLVQRLAAVGVTANSVTLAAMVISIALGVWLYVSALTTPAWFLLLPLWMFVRMAFNAVDGMLAREHHQQSPLGAYLNELSDVISDAALYLPFCLIPPFSPLGIFAVIWCAALSEMTGALGPMIGVQRQYQGPMGKSDRAFVFGALGLSVGLGFLLPAVLNWLPWVLCLLMAANMAARIKAALGELPHC